MSPAADEDLLARQSALQQEAREVLAGLDLAALVAGAGSLLVTGSFVSGLMCWPEVDVMVHVGSDFSPPDVMSLLARIVSRPGVTGLDYRDERGPRCVTGQVRDERYHVPLTVEHAGQSWQIDLTLWLHDPHLNVTRWHEELHARITAEERIAVLPSKTTGAAGRPTRIRSAACRSTPRSSTTECAPQASSLRGSPSRACQ